MDEMERRAELKVISKETRSGLYSVEMSWVVSASVRVILLTHFISR